MTRSKKESYKKTTTGRIRRVPEKKKVVNYKNFKVSDINMKKFLETVKSNFDNEEEKSKSRKDSNKNVGVCFPYLLLRLFVSHTCLPSYIFTEFIDES